jgi:hypothetical protein
MTEKKMSPEQMRMEIERQNQEDIRLCGVAIEAALTKFDCRLDAQTLIRNNAVASQVLILKND